MAWKRGSWRDGILGGFLIFVLPVLIVIVAGLYWWGYLGTDDAIRMDPPRVEEEPLSDPGLVED